MRFLVIVMQKVKTNNITITLSLDIIICNIDAIVLEDSYSNEVTVTQSHSYVFDGWVLMTEI